MKGFLYFQSRIRIAEEFKQFLLDGMIDQFDQLRLINFKDFGGHSLLSRERQDI